MYKIYASKPNCGLTPTDDALVIYRFQDRDQTAKQCIELFRNGFTIHKLLLPAGGEITRDRIEHALKIGVHSVGAAIGK